MRYTKVCHREKLGIYYRPMSTPTTMPKPLKKWKALWGALDFINLKLERIMLSNAEVAQGLIDLTTHVAKIGVETGVTLQLTKDLEAQLAANAANNAVSPELEAAFLALKVQVQRVDDMIPDAANQPPAAPEGTPVAPVVIPVDTAPVETAPGSSESAPAGGDAPTGDGAPAGDAATDTPPAGDNAAT